MKHLSALLIFIHLTFHVFGQTSIKNRHFSNSKKQNEVLLRASSGNRTKPVIDSTAINHWISLGNYVSISNNGKHTAYIIQNKPYKSNTLVIQSITTSWKKELQNVSPICFSPDSKQYIYAKQDTLHFLTVESDQVKKVADVASYQSLAATNGMWLSWQLKSAPHVLVIHNLFNNTETRYSNVENYSFNETGNAVVLQLQTKKGNALKLVDLLSKKTDTIWTSELSGTSINTYAIDHSGRQVCFLLQDTSSPYSPTKPNNTLWYYKTGMYKATQKANNQYIEPGLNIQGPIKFSDDGKQIYFNLQEHEIPPPPPGYTKLDIWHYKDTVLQSTQLLNQAPRSYLATINCDGNKVIRLQYDFETPVVFSREGFMVMASNTSGDRFWLEQQDTNWLVPPQGGTRKLIKTVGSCSFWFSPDGTYLVYYDSGQGNNYFSYNLKTGKLNNISTAVPPNHLALIDQYQLPDTVTINPVGIAAWLKHDAAILVYANYDIWQLDLTGRNPAINVTNAFGSQHHIKFRLVNDALDRELADEDKLLLSAFNTRNKQNGFFTKSLGNNIPPKLLTMENRVFYLSRKIYCINDVDFNAGMKPIKANGANTWIIKRQSATESPNYYVTSDFKNYKALTNLQSEKAFNWLTAELINFRQLDGTYSQGVLYKPENFDPTKKYPVLFNYYEQLSHRLYQFPRPYFIRTIIDIPWFVSRGYLVFTPDIHFTKGLSGRSALNTIAGAAMHLSSLPYVDRTKMGLNGHSVGGGLTNYIITHSNLFAAAVEGAGVSDILSSALQLSSGTSRLMSYDAILWQNTHTLLEESPIMNIDKVTTPLIIFHSKSDSAVPWEQAVELFIALRRHQKKCWILQYDEGNHGLWWSNKDCEDYTIRITQFFDHYLKGITPPRWMTQGIPTRLKGLETGYELDTSGRMP